MLDIIIVNWNAGEQLLSCLKSVAASHNVTKLVSHVVVVDNASTDGSADNLDILPLPLSVIRNDRNRGFAAACNQGAKGSQAEYLLFLNPDAEVYPNTIEAVVDFMNDPDRQRTGVCGVKLRDDTGRIARGSTRLMQPADVLIAMLGLDKLFPGLFRTHFMREWDHEESREVDHVIGAFYCIRRRLFEQLGGFDERFFVYLEDLDLSLRVQQAGFVVQYLADIEAFHKGGGTSEQAKAARLYYSLRSRILYGYKHFHSAVALVLAAGTLVLEPVARSVALAVQRDRRGLSETLGGFRRLWAEAPALLTGRADRLSV